MEQENRHGAFLEDRAGDRAEEELAQHRLAMSTHHEQAGPQAANLFLDDLTRLGRGLQYDGDRLDLVIGEELPARSACWAASSALRSTLMMWTGADCRAPSPRMPPGAGGLATPVVRNDDRAFRESLRRCCDNRPRRVLQDRLERLILLIISRVNRNRD